MRGADIERPDATEDLADGGKHHTQLEKKVIYLGYTFSPDFIKNSDNRLSLLNDIATE